MQFRTTLRTTRTVVALAHGGCGVGVRGALARCTGAGAGGRFELHLGASNACVSIGVAVDAVVVGLVPGLAFAVRLGVGGLRRC